MGSFGKRIAQARKAGGFRLKDLARKICKPDGQPISIPYLSDLERDRRTPSAALLPQFASILHIPEDLLSFALGNLPPDCQSIYCNDEQIIAAFQVFRRALQSTSSGSFDDTPSYRVSYQRAEQRTLPRTLPNTMQ